MDKPVKYTLKNGIEVACYQVKGVRGVAINFGLLAGSSLEPQDKVGTFHFLEHLMFKGCKKYPNWKDQATKAEELGISYNGGVGSLNTSFWFLSPDTNFIPATEFARDVLTEPIINNEDIENSRKVILTEQKNHWDYPENRFYNDARKSWLREGHIYLRRGFGDQKVVEKVGRVDIQNAYDLLYIPSNLKVSIAGNISPEKAFSQLEKTFGLWKKEGSKVKIPRPKIPKAKPDFLFFQEKKNQLRFSFSFEMKGYKEYETKEALIIGLLNYLLCEGQTSQLYIKIREELGLVYNIHSYKIYWPYYGQVGVDGMVTPENLLSALAEIINVLKAISSNGFDKSDFERAKKYMDAQTLIGFTEIGHIAGKYLIDLLDDEELLTPSDYISIASTITLEDVNNFFRKIINFQTMHLGIMGDEGSVDLTKVKSMFEKATK